MKETISGRVIYVSFVPGQPYVLHLQVRVGEGIANVRIMLNDDDDSPTVDGVAVCVTELLAALLGDEYDGVFSSEKGVPFSGGTFTKVPS